MDDLKAARIFLLSPASCSGARAQLLLSERASFELAKRIRDPAGAPIGEVFSFLSGLYFRGKLAYARAFSRLPRRRTRGIDSGVLVITPARGLRSADDPVTVEDLREFARVDVRADNPSYRVPLEETARQAAATTGSRCDVVLLGSIATDKYVDVLTRIFGARLRFPREFVGRGDMSRGGLMLRCVATGRELTYVPVLGARRHGQRPPRLEPVVRSVRADPSVRECRQGHWAGLNSATGHVRKASPTKIQD